MHEFKYRVQNTIMPKPWPFGKVVIFTGVAPQDRPRAMSFAFGLKNVDVVKVEFE